MEKFGELRHLDDFYYENQKNFNCPNKYNRYALKI